MGKLKELYQKNIYGVMGTLVFHIVVVVSLLFTDIRTEEETKEGYISIDLEAPEIIKPEIPEESEPQEESPEQTAEARAAVSNRAVNDASRAGRNSGGAGYRGNASDAFFDEDYRREIDEAQQLVASVNRQLSKKAPKMEDIQMPEEKTDGIDPDSISNTVYSGKSNIHYSLENRYHRSLPIPVYLAQGGGQVIVDIWVSPAGSVIRAEVRPNSAIADPMLPEYAGKAAEKTLFNPDQSAPSPQKGTITYTFVPQ